MRHSFHKSAVIGRAASCLLAFVITLGFLNHSAAQTRRKGGVAPREQAAAQNRDAANDGTTCGWRGTVDINRNTSESDTKVTARGEHISDQFYSGKKTYKFTFDYHGSFDVRNSPGSVYEDGSFSATLRGSFTANAIRVTEETDNSTSDTDCFPDPPKTIKTDSLLNITERASAEGTIDDGTLIVRGGRFSLSFGLPEIEGKSTKNTKHSVTGLCMKENEENYADTQESPVSFSREVVQVEGALDPKNPNALRGEHRPDADTLITWNLFRPEGECDEPLVFKELRLAHHRFPDKVAWADIEGSTVDGNRVRVVAVVANNSKKEKSGTVTFKEVTSGLVLETKPVTVPPKGEAEVEAEWDTNGFAWTDDGAKAPEREIEARLATGDTAAEKVYVNPKPVILVHGLWSNAAAWGAYQGFLNEAHSFAWRGFAVGANPGVAIMNTGDHFGNSAPTNTIAQNAEQLGRQVRAVQTELNAWHVDLVAHSMGGLISRYYIHTLMATDSPDKRPYVTNLVMLGTPNEGSPCADLMYPAYKAAGNHVEALRQLRPSVVEEFNGQVTNRKGVRFSILAGYPVPRTCQNKSWGDGVVSIPSALWQVSDRDYAPRVHTAITGREDFFSFVKPRLALGPKRAKEMAALYGVSDDAANLTVEGRLLASLRPTALPANPETDATRILLSKSLKVEPGRSAEVAFGVTEKGDSGVTFVAPPTLKVSLVGADGAVEEAAEASGPFQTFYLDRAGSWTLRLENGGDAAAVASVAVWASGASALAVEFAELQSQPDGSLKLQAKVTGANGEAVKGAAVSVRLNGQPAETPLRDDGRGGDAAAGDGVYGATTGKLGAGETFVEVKAFSNGLTATANAFVSGRR